MPDTHLHLVSGLVPRFLCGADCVPFYHDLLCLCLFVHRHSLLRFYTGVKEYEQTAAATRAASLTSPTEPAPPCLYRGRPAVLLPQSQASPPLGSTRAIQGYLEDGNRAEGTSLPLAPSSSSFRFNQVSSMRQSRCRATMTTSHLTLHPDTASSPAQPVVTVVQVVLAWRGATAVGRLSPTYNAFPKHQGNTLAGSPGPVT